MIYNIEENEVMKSFDNIIELINNMFEEKVLVAFNNTKESIKVYDGENIALKVKVGQAVLKDSAAYECMDKQKFINKIIPKEIFGEPYKVFAFPVFDGNGVVEGCISICKSLTRQNKILNIAENIELRVKEISEIVGEIAKGVQHIAGESEIINTKAKDVKVEVDKSDEIFSIVDDITDQSNLLAINARIEAARVGELGKGFAVVAKEMGILANSSKDSLDKIDEKLKNIKNSFNDIIGKYSNMNSIFNEQVAALEEISATIEELNETSTSLRIMAEEM